MIVSVMSWAAGEESGQQHLVAWLALLLLAAGVLVTFREASVFNLAVRSVLSDKTRERINAKTQRGHCIAP